ncbi:MAG: hypothetical protein MI750_16950 [Xanthomonadales bacterium]|jgi:predicted O-methyltransferase YrrM|nr:hypothetical protein [Xanthomonadales bacterium]
MSARPHLAKAPHISVDTHQQSSLHGFDSKDLQQLEHQLPASLRLQIQGYTKRGRVRGWALAPTSAIQLAYLVWRLKPRQILEFGSGTSTLALALTARFLEREGHSCHILSLDQEWKYADRTRFRLTEANLAPYADVIHIPLQSQEAFGQSIFSYGIDAKQLRQYLQAPVDFAFIDGPASAPLLGRPGSRLGILPLCMNVAATSMHFVLDDSKRSKEQSILKMWSSLQGVEVLEHSKLDRGMSLGLYTAPSANPVD